MKTSIKALFLATAMTFAAGSVFADDLLTADIIEAVAAVTDGTDLTALSGATDLATDDSNFALVVQIGDAGNAAVVQANGVGNRAIILQDNTTNPGVALISQNGNMNFAKVVQR